MRLTLLGNFQKVNFDGAGGKGGDAVSVSVQDPGGTNNANFRLRGQNYAAEFMDVFAGSDGAGKVYGFYGYGSAAMVWATAGSERIRLTNGGLVGIGMAGGSPTIQLEVHSNASSVILGTGTTNNFLQINMKNTNAGTTASSDLVATSDNGSDTTHYVDLGINSSVNSDASYTLFGAGDAYCYSQDSNLWIGTAGAKVLGFFIGGTLTANEVARFDTNRSFLINTTSSPGAGTLIQAVKGQNASTFVEVKNTNAGASGQATFKATSDGASSFYFGQGSAASVFSGGGFIYTDGNLPITQWTNNTKRIITLGTGQTGFGISNVPSAPTAVIHLGASTATANTAPLQFTAGTLETVARAGVMNFDGTNFYFEI